MNWDLHAIPESESPDVRRFLNGIFKPSGDAVFLSPEQLHWKYWELHPGWSGPRSYGFRDHSGDLLAHAGAWPFSLEVAGETVSGVHPIDWAAAPQARGAGAQLLRQMRAMRDICCCTGGTDIAQVVVRQCGFKPAATMQMLARPLRPVRQALTHRRNWKLPVRFLRNAVWTMKGASVPSGWVAEPALPGEWTGAVLPTAARDIAVASRSNALFEYLLKSPTARYQLWQVRQGGEPRGYFFLSFVPGQARIADAWIVSESQNAQAWRALYALAIDAALRDGSASEITTGTTLTEACEGAMACGFRSYGEWPVMLYDPKGQLACAREIHLQMMDNDSSFLHNNCIEYVT